MCAKRETSRLRSVSREEPQSLGSLKCGARSEARLAWARSAHCLSDKIINIGVPVLMQQVNDLACLCGGASLIPSPAQWVKDLVLLQLWRRSQLQLGFSSCPGNFHVLQVWLKKEKKIQKVPGKETCPKRLGGCGSIMLRDTCFFATLLSFPIF